MKQIFEKLGYRRFIPSRFYFVFAIIAAALFPACGAGSTETAENPWSQFPSIITRIKAPSFPNRYFPITKFGAAEGGTNDCTAAIRKAIEACHEGGGGHVIIPPGKFVTGAIHLLSGVDLHVQKGATLLFQTDPNAYLPPVFTRFEGMECF